MGETVIAEGQIIVLQGLRYYVDEVEYNGYLGQSMSGQKLFRDSGSSAVRRIVLKGVAEDE